MINQSLLNGSINASSFGDIRCDLFMYEIDDITNSNAMYSPNVNHYYKYNRKEFNKYYLIIKYIEINKIKTNIINNKKQYIMLNLTWVILFYKMIDDIIKAIYIPKIDMYYIYNTEHCLKTKCNVMNRIKWNIINNSKQCVLINLLYVRLLYEIIWLIILALRMFIVTKYWTHHWCVVFDYFHQ